MLSKLLAIRVFRIAKGTEKERQRDGYAASGTILSVPLKCRDRQTPANKCLCQHHFKQFAYSELIKR